MTEINLSITPEDDIDFIRIIKKIINSVVIKHKPVNVVIVQIDNWFDHKWLRFSGQFLGELGLWKKELTLPPFNPNRVINQTVYQLTDDVYERIKAPDIHIYQDSLDNCTRKVSQMTDSGVYIWYSSNTVKNGKGSLMIYCQTGNESTPWFVSFEKVIDWRINKAKGISVEVVKEYIV